MGNATKSWWENTKKTLSSLEPYSKEETRSILLKDNLFEKFIGKAKNRTLIKYDPKLYVSILTQTKELEDLFKREKRDKGSYNLRYRIKFIVERGYDISSLKCSCGQRHSWTDYCRKCPDYKYNQAGKSHSEATKNKMRVSTLKYLSELKGQIVPRYNKDSIGIIEEYGERNNYNFLHAENGGEHHIKELGYFVDAYDPEANVVLEIDEPYHFTIEGDLREKDKIRQRQIEDALGCTFIRIRYDRV